MRLASRLSLSPLILLPHPLIWICFFLLLFLPPPRSGQSDSADACLVIPHFASALSFRFLFSPHPYTLIRRQHSKLKPAPPSPPVLSFQSSSLRFALPALLGCLSSERRLLLTLPLSLSCLSLSIITISLSFSLLRPHRQFGPIHPPQTAHSPLLSPSLVSSLPLLCPSPPQTRSSLLGHVHHHPSASRHSHPPST